MLLLRGVVPGGGGGGFGGGGGGGAPRAMPLHRAQEEHPASHFFRSESDALALRNPRPTGAATPPPPPPGSFARLSRRLVGDSQ